MSTATIEAVERVLKAKPSPEVRDPGRVEIGQVLHQGDVYLHRVPEDWPRGKLLGTRQIAVGDTIGSRHVVHGQGFEVYAGVALPAYATFERLPAHQRSAARAECLGPVVVLTEELAEGEGLVHPEHAHHRMPRGVYQVQYQLDGQTARRVAD